MYPSQWKRVEIVLCYSLVDARAKVHLLTNHISAYAIAVVKRTLRPFFL